MLSKPIYLDYNATTPVDPAVFEAMKPYFTEAYGNPSSVSHAYGWEADSAVKKSRNQVASLIGCQSHEITFTSGATESNNIALIGLFKSFLTKKEPAHLVTSAIEHKSVLEVSQALEKLGVEVTYLKPNREGFIDPKQVAMAIEPTTKLVSIIHAQNEIGTIQNIESIGQLLKEKGIPFHIDAAQSVGKIRIDLKTLCVDMLSASSQKMYGPKGSGFLYVRKNHQQLSLEPIMYGGPQEQGLRPGTLNVPGIVGLGKACELAEQNMPDEASRIEKLQNKFINEVLSIGEGHIKLNGPANNRIYSNVSFTFTGLNSDVFALGLSGLAVSTTSACSGGAPSHVLKSIGHSLNDIHSTVRFGLGRFTTNEDIEIAIQKIKDLFKKNASFQDTM